MVRMAKETQSSPQLSGRLTKYGVAAVAAVATGVAADNASASLVSTPVNISAANSVEAFVNILPFASGANSVSVTFTTNTFSMANPFAPNSELMLRGVNGLAQMSPRNGGVGIAAGFVSSGYLYVLNVGTPFTVPTGTAGTVVFNSANNGSLTYTAFGNGQFPVGGSGVAFFQFINTGTGLPHNGWASVTIDTDLATGSLKPTITAIHVDTTPVPEPSTGMALLCLGAAGLARYRRRREDA